MSDNIPLKAYTGPARENLYRDVALRVYGEVPSDVIMKEFNLSEIDFKRVLASKVFRETLAQQKVIDAELMVQKQELEFEHIQNEAFASFEALKAHRDAGLPSETNDARLRRMSMDVCKWILENAGFKAPDKSISLSAEVTIDNDLAKELLLALKDTSYSSERSVLNVTPAELARPEYRALVKPNLAGAVDERDTPPSISMEALRDDDAPRPVDPHSEGSQAREDSLQPKGPQGQSSR